MRYGGGVVSQEDAVALGMKPDSSKIEEYLAGLPDRKAEVEACDGVGWRGQYEPPPRKFSEMMKVSCTTIVRLGWHMRSELVREALVYQQGELEYAVAALCIWLMTATGVYVCSRLALHRVKLRDWPDLVKPFASDARRLGQIFGEGYAEVEHAMLVRKLVALCGRSSEEADWASELRDRTTPTAGKRAYANGVISQEAFVKLRWHTLRRIAAEAVRTVAKKCSSMENYFNERWWNTPAGTTSLGGAVKARFGDIGGDVFDFGMRATKKAVMQVVDRNCVYAWCEGLPRSVARGSTKPEPGMKRRALLAVDDATAFIAGYASDRIESGVKLDGMVLKQDPVDVAEWVAFDAGKAGWRVSNDYTNFNMLHSLASLQCVDLALAEAWSHVDEPWAEDKVLANIWVALSYDRAFVSTPGGDARVISGLWSGHRNTARDNTFLHLVYLDAIKGVMTGLFGTDGQVSQQRICGDDEVVTYQAYAAAVCHTLVADALGFESQVSKGMLSERRDEFLQLVRNPGSLPTYPVAHTILTFCSGNWYKDAVRDIGSTVKDISDQVFDIVTGGLPLREGQELAAAVCDYLMKVKSPSGELVALEWVDYRSGGNPDGHPLWRHLTTLPPIDVPLPTPKVDVPANATQDGFMRENEAWAGVDHAEQKRVKAERTWASYRSVARHWLQGHYDAAVCKVWPVRKRGMGSMRRILLDEQNRLKGPYEPPVVPANRWRATAKRGIQRSIRAAAFECKFPPELMGTRFEHQAKLALSARDRAKLNVAEADKQPSTVGWRWYVPAHLRAV